MVQQAQLTFYRCWPCASSIPKHFNYVYFCINRCNWDKYPDNPVHPVRYKPGHIPPVCPSYSWLFCSGTNSLPCHQQYQVSTPWNGARSGSAWNLLCNGCSGSRAVQRLVLPCSVHEKAGVLAAFAGCSGRQFENSISKISTSKRWNLSIKDWEKGIPRCANFLWLTHHVFDAHILKGIFSLTKMKLFIHIQNG